VLKIILKLGLEMHTTLLCARHTRNCGTTFQYIWDKPNPANRHWL